jgi:parvulin-like peptidyl-prolyl isomerase
MALGVVIIGGSALAFLRPDLLSRWISNAITSPSVESARSQGSDADFASEGNSPAKSVFDFQEVERLVETLSPESRKQVLIDQAAFTRLVREEAVRRSVLEAARTTGLVNNEHVAYLMNRAADQVLFNSYIQLESRGRVSSDYPSDVQIQSFYEQNRAKFTTEAQVMVWQVFIPVPTSADSETITERATFADKLSEQIRQNKVSFPDAALAHSGHEASRRQGGFIGLVRISQLIPEVRDAVVTLENGQIGGPIRSKSGFHIIRRDLLIPARVVPLAEVREQIRTQLGQVAQREIQQAVVSAAHRASGDLPSERDIEAWRSKLVGRNDSDN